VTAAVVPLLIIIDLSPGQAGYRSPEGMQQPQGAWLTKILLR
jgi:hypothetical protein